MASALEHEVRARIFALKRSTDVHDRAVLLGFCMTLIPVVPVTLIGLIVCVLNLRLVKGGKLPANERPLILKGIGLGMLNLLLGAVGLYCLISIALTTDFYHLITTARLLLRSIGWF